MKFKNQRRVEGEERNKAWNLLSPSEKLHDLDQRLGKGVGARKQRAKLEGLIPPKKVKEEIYV